MGILKSIAGGIADVVRQPATFAKKLGSTIGEAAANTSTGRYLGKSMVNLGQRLGGVKLTEDQLRKNGKKCQKT